MVEAIVLSGAIGLLSTEARPQEAPGRIRQPDFTQPSGVGELSKNDMKTVEEALQAKGFKVGRVDGVADEETRRSIRSFQQENGLPITGTIDLRTANKLGVKISIPGSSKQNRLNRETRERADRILT